MQRKSKILCLILSLVFVFAIGLTACGGGGSSSEESDELVKIEFWGDGVDTEVQVFTNLVNAFNKQNEGKIKVKYRRKDNIVNAVQPVLGTADAPDVFYVGDGEYKKYVEAGYLADITSYVTNSTVIDTNDMWPSIYNRYFYSTQNHRSGDNAVNGKWYGLPKDIGPTVLFYNESWLNKAGVYVISCYEEDIAAFNAGAQDTRGNTLSMVYDAKKETTRAISGNALKKGFFQDASGNYYFNNKIAMSWEETRALAVLLETNKPTEQLSKGYHTEWWFNYGWSVGGDCIEYIETDDPAYSGGYYDFTLVDDTKNFIVADDCAAGVTVNGTHYNAGEIISYQDKLTNEEELAGLITRAGAAKYDEILKNNANIKELPSQREAFVEFVLLSSSKSQTINGIKGYEVCFKPTEMGGDGAKAEAFANQTVGMLVDGRWNVTNFRTGAVAFNWDVAPLPIYKEYVGDTDEVAVHGIAAGHSGSVSLSISQYSSNKAAAWKFVEYLAGPEGQKAQSLQGFAIPSQISVATDTTHGWFLNQKDEVGNLLAPLNAEIFIAAARCEHEGDWSYLKTGNLWINDWAGQLNGDVRNGRMSFEDFINGATFRATFDTIKEYTKA